eukprot:7389552-Prymnesium_polylepis.1
MRTKVEARLHQNLKGTREVVALQHGLVVISYSPPAADFDIVGICGPRVVEVVAGGRKESCKLLPGCEQLDVRLQV